MKKICLILCLMFISVSGAYAYNFLPGPFPYPYPNLIDDYPNAAYCRNVQPMQYPSYKVDGVLSPQFQSNGCVTYYWSSSCVTAYYPNYQQPIQKVKRSVIVPGPTLKNITRSSPMESPIVPAKRYNWGRPF